MAKTSSALAFASDEKFAPLAKGLVLSLLRFASSDISLYLIDIGCSSESVQWMKSHNVSVLNFERSKYLPSDVDSCIKSYQDAQLVRPFLPKILPYHDVYIWCDADIWVQNIDSILLYRDIALEYPSHIPLSPLVDVSYNYHYNDGTEFMRYSKHWYGGCYGPTTASTYADKAVLNSGVFAMHKDNPLWGAWARDIARIFARGFDDHYQSHLAEQTILSYLAYSGNAVKPVEAIHNYNCHAGSVVRRGDDVVIDSPPYRKLGVVHLTYSSKLLPKYLEDGILYNKGSYLNAAEIASLSKLDHY